MRLPRLPVSRRRQRIERELRDEFDFERQARAKLEREMMQDLSEARARVAELEQAIRSHRDHEFPDGEHDAVQRFEQAMTVNRKLWSVLDGHDRQERGDVPVTYQDGSGYMMSWEADGDH